MKSACQRVYDTERCPEHNFVLEGHRGEECASACCCHQVAS
jgi:hypothetical protein